MEMIEDVAENATTTPTCDKSSQVGNAAKCKELLGEVYVLLDKSKSYINDIKSIDRRREISHYLTRAKNLVDNLIWVVVSGMRIKDAFAKPPRNIDHINTYEDMCAAWNTYVRTTHKTNVGSFFVWLFDNVKGENNGQTNK